MVPGLYLPRSPFLVSLSSLASAQRLSFSFAPPHLAHLHLGGPASCQMSARCRCRCSPVEALRLGGGLAALAVELAEPAAAALDGAVPFYEHRPRAPNLLLPDAHVGPPVADPLCDEKRSMKKSVGGGGQSLTPKGKGTKGTFFLSPNQTTFDLDLRLEPWDFVGCVPPTT